MAQVQKGPPWFAERPTADLWPYLNNTEATSFAMDIRNIETANLTLEVSGDNTVSFKYKFRDFLGETMVFAKSPPPTLLETRCQEFEASQEADIPLLTSNFTEYFKDIYVYRWISPIFGNQ